MVKKKRKHGNTFGTSSSLNQRGGKKSESIASIFHVSGLHGVQQKHDHHEEQIESMDDCLALLDQQYIPSNKNDIENEQSPNICSVTIESSSTNPENTAKESGNAKKSILLSNENGVHRNGSDSMQSNYLQVLPDQIIKNGELVLPNIQVELARHKFMGELSQYILSECPSLRMPSFERWVMDSKIEERLKRDKLKNENKRRHQQQLSEDNLSMNNGRSSNWRSRMKRKNMVSDDGDTDQLLHITSTGKNPMYRYDPVIPSMPDDVNDGASQRLLKEITGTEIKNKEVDVEKRRKAIVKELCRRACEASRCVQNLSSRLGGGVEANKYILKSSGIAQKKNRKAKSQHSLGHIVFEINSSEGYLKEGERNEESFTDKTNPVYLLSYIKKTKKSNSSQSCSREMKPFHVKINATHYEKLRDMFHSIHNRNNEQLNTSGLPTANLFVPPVSENSKSSTPATKIFHHLLFCVLVRYASLSGGQQLLDLRGGGMQGAIHSQVFDFLSNYSLKSSSANNCNIMECFASPLNVYSTHFCSVFHEDLDCHFGSYGDFFSVPLGFFGKIGRVHETNPPFAPGMMELMVKRIEDHLEFADSLANDLSSDESQDKSRLTFIIIVPSCDDRYANNNLVTRFAQKSHQGMLSSPYFSKHMVLKAREHGYVEASQHMRPTRYKDSQYDTSVIILQSHSARIDEKDEPKLTSIEAETGLREAFVSRHHKELNERRSRKVSVTKRKVTKDKQKMIA